MPKAFKAKQEKGGSGITVDLPVVFSGFHKKQTTGA